MARLSILEKFYNGMSLAEIKKDNPYTTNDFLKNTAVLSNTRLQAIIDLFDGKETVSSAEITEKDYESGSRNWGTYPAFRAIAHDLAVHDGRGGLIATEEGRQKLNISASSPTPKTILKKGSRTPDCEIPSLQEIDEIHSKYFGNKEVSFEEVFNKVEIEAEKNGRILCPDWREKVENNLDDTED